MSLGSDKPRSRLPLGRVDAIENKNKKGEEPVRWARVHLEDENQAEGTFLFTFEELKNAMIRAQTQREDLPQRMALAWVTSVRLKTTIGKRGR